MAQRTSRRIRNLNNYVLIILDSCRYDSFVRARPKNMRRLGQLEKRWSYASWTAPSLCSFLMGLMPHTSPRRIFAAEYYRKDFAQYSERLGAPDIRLESLVPKLSLPYFLQSVLGYQTHAMVSLPVVNPSTLLNFGFDTYRLMEKHNDMRAMLHLMRFAQSQPSFYLLNVGETHYPYALPGEPPNQWPKLSGVHGVFRQLANKGGNERQAGARRIFFSRAELTQLRERQVEAVRYLDTVAGELFDLVPERTFVTITADHGELFGEDGYFGHGPIHHPKVFEVPFIEGRVR